MDNIAVIGVANLFPGSKNLDEFWQGLTQKQDLRRKATALEMGVNPEHYFGVEGQSDKYYCLSGGYIGEFSHDLSAYRLPESYLTGLDDMYQWSLYVAKQALLDAGYADNEQLLRKCGVILGNLSFPTKKSNHLFMPIYHKTVQRALRDAFNKQDFMLDGFTKHDKVHPANALIAGYPSAVIAQCLGLGGTHFSLDAACASSCYSVKIASDYLNTGKADLMLAGAVSGSDPFFINMGFSIFHAYPDDNVSAPLDTASGGLFAGEGAGMLVLKRYADAKRDGDRVYAVIRGGALSNDGKGEFVLSPNTKGQVLVYERAYKQAQVDPKEVDFVECHATGTPKGDKVELTSMETYFSRYNTKPLIGSVKSNLGHLLTAAGMPGMTKTILSMKEGIIPPTINVNNAVQSKSGYIGSDLIPRDVINWPSKSDANKKIAGVSVFGFGGSNAHIVFQEDSSVLEQQLLQQTVQPENNFQSMAIVAMDVHFGDCEGIDAFTDTVLNGKQHFQSLPIQRWKGIDSEHALLEEYRIPNAAAPKGAYLENFDIDFLRFKIPPNENDSLIPQQLLMIRAADNAAKAAQLSESSNVAVLVAMGVELELHQFRGRVNLATQLEASFLASGIVLNDQQRQELIAIAKDGVHNAAQLNQYTSFIGNIMASRVSALWDFSGPAITISSEENSVNRCLQTAEVLFRTSDVEAVIIAAVDLAGGAEHVLMRNQICKVNSGSPGFCYKKDSDGWDVGEGVAAVVLKRQQDATANGDKIYASIEAITMQAGVDTESVTAAAQTALGQAGVSASAIDYVELNASGVDEFDQAELGGLEKIYSNKPSGSVKANIGHTYSASGLASIIKVALCLDSRQLPLATLEKSQLRANFPFNIVDRKHGINESSHMAINCIGHDGSTAHVILCSSKSAVEPKIRSVEQAKKKPQLIKNIRLGGESIRDTIIRSVQQNFSAFSWSATNARVDNPLSSLTNDHSLIPFPKVPHSEVIMMKSNNKAKTTDANMQRELTQLLQRSRDLVAAHSTFLDSRLSAIENIGEMLKLQMVISKPSTNVAHLPALDEVIEENQWQLVERYNKPKKIIWDQAELVEFAEGSIANVFGPEFAVIDSYSRRVRLPTTDYLLVTRVTELDAKVGDYSACMMTTEYDIPTDAPYLIDGQIPWCVSVESGQCDLLLISYLGIDFQNKGERVYRLLDCTLTFLDDMALGGETLRYEIHIDSFARNGDTLLFFFHYDCYVEDKMVLTMRGGCAGFFTDEELADGKGVILSEDEKEERKNIRRQSFTPFISNQQSQFEMTDMLKLVQGDVQGCFGPSYAQSGNNCSLKFSSEKFLMIERVTKIDRQGGPWGLGLLEGEKRLEPNHWYFPCHFKDDQVMAGSLMAEGCGQLVMFFMLYLGMQTKVSDARFQPMPGEAQKVRCRGQVLPQSNTLTYRMEVTEIGVEPYPYMKANVDIILDGKVVVDFKNLGVMMKESGDFSQRLSHTPVNTLNEKRDPFANIHAPLMKVENDLEAPRNKGVIPIKHFEAPPVAGQNRIPNTVPFEPWHLFEFATGNVSNCFGGDYDIYEGLIPPRTPCGDLQLTTRVIDAKGERGNFKELSSCVAEYEVPEDAWYFAKNSHFTVMPYSVLMEISLQPNGFLSTYMGSTLGFPGKELFFRNLDGNGKLLRDVDLRGKTIVNSSELLSTSIAGANIIQSFSFLLSVDGQPFYEGKAVFGYFAAEALANQLGIDNGRKTIPWHIEAKRGAERIDLRDADHRFFQVQPAKPHHRLAGGQLHFIDTVDVVEGGGKYDKGYLYAERAIDASDWFFQYHFHQDPVMPGSLGVEAIIETLQVWMLKQGFGDQMRNPRFAQILSTITWKYRGQIIPTNQQMSLDLHIKEVIEQPGKVTVVADANLMKDELRIYEVTDLAICLEEI